MGANTLEVADLSVFLPSRDGAGAAGWQQVVKGVSFSLPPGKTVALVGGSGSGKSVTSMAIMRLLDPKRSYVQGSIRLNAVELTTLSEPNIRAIRGNQISMIFQEPMTSLNPVVSIGSQITETLITHQGLSRTAARRQAIELLDRVKLPSAATRIDDFPHQFSGGQRQRILIAAALACEPRVLIADEPTTALDVTVQAKILDLIRDLQADNGMSVLFITHDMGVVAEIADETVVMYRGEVVESGSTEQMFAEPKQPYTKALLGAVPRLGSMQGTRLPKRFAIIDSVTGEAEPSAETVDTVDRQSADLLSVDHLVKEYPAQRAAFQRGSATVRAVRDVTLDLKAGETLSLVGESGCGKSTTGRTIIKLQDPTSGHILFDGVDLATLNGKRLREERTQIQMIFQDPYASLNPRMTVGKALAEPMLAHGMGDARAASAKVAELLALVGLDANAAERLPHEFSGGQRQRISIARALTLQPRLIVADEVVSALDVLVKAQVINLMVDLQEKLGLAYLFISHDMAVVERISHRVAVMRAGEIVEMGPRSAIFECPQHPYTKALLAAVPLPDPARRAASGRPVVPPRPVVTPDVDGPIEQLREVAPQHWVRLAA